MNKPIVLKYAEFKQELAYVINQSGLPAFLIEYILRDYLEETHNAASLQYYEAQQQYTEALKQESFVAEECKE